mgnify:CR=1 FL=1
MCKIESGVREESSRCVTVVVLLHWQDLWAESPWLAQLPELLWKQSGEAEFVGGSQPQFCSRVSPLHATERGLRTPVDES